MRNYRIILALGDLENLLGESTKEVRQVIMF